MSPSRRARGRIGVPHQVEEANRIANRLVRERAFEAPQTPQEYRHDRVVISNPPVIPDVSSSGWGPKIEVPARDDGSIDVNMVLEATRDQFVNTVRNKLQELNCSAGDTIIINYQFMLNIGPKFVGFSEETPVEGEHPVSGERKLYWEKENKDDQ